MGRHKNEDEAFSILDRFSAWCKVNFWVSVYYLLGSVDFSIVDFSIVIL